MPGARQQVAVEITLRQAVPLVRAGVVDGEHALAGTHEAETMAVDVHHLHGADGEGVQMSNEVSDFGAHVAHGKTSTMVEVKRLSIGEVAARSGVATSALRFYEEHGLITSDRADSNHRRYHADVLRRVSFIRVAQKVGLTLAEIRSALELLPDGRTPNRHDWADLAAAGAHVSTSRSRRCSGSATTSTAASAAAACRSRRARSGTPTTSRPSSAPGPATC